MFLENASFMYAFWVVSPNSFNLEKRWSRFIISCVFRWVSCLKPLWQTKITISNGTNLASHDSPVSLDRIYRMVRILYFCLSWRKAKTSIPLSLREASYYFPQPRWNSLRFHRAGRRIEFFSLPSGKGESAKINPVNPACPACPVGSDIVLGLNEPPYLTGVDPVE